MSHCKDSMIFYAIIHETERKSANFHKLARIPYKKVIVGAMGFGKSKIHRRRIICCGMARPFENRFARMVKPLALIRTGIALTQAFDLF